MYLICNNSNFIQLKFKCKQKQKISHVIKTTEFFIYSKSSKNYFFFKKKHNLSYIKNLL